MIPVYESIETLHNVQTYSSDDFYGFLESEEGEWLENVEGNHTLDIAIGRIPAKNTAQAQIYLEKLKKFSSNNLDQSWKSEIIFVADDKDDGLHTNQADELASLVEKNGNFMHINKVYLDAFERQSADKIEFAKNTFLNKVNHGVSFVNFTGHGSEYVWMEEQLLTIGAIRSLKNQETPSVFITATCEFGRYDDPEIQSGADELIFNSGGAIAMVTTTRPVYSSSNFAINKSFYNEVFKKDTITQLFRSLGDVFIDTKNKSLNGVFNRNFSLLGDPSLSINMPNKTVVLDSINSTLAQEFTDTIHPLESFWLKGKIVSTTNKTDSTFDGCVQLKIYDAPETKNTLGFGDQFKVNFDAETTPIFIADIPVENGFFSAELVLPLEISSSFGTSQFLFFANSVLNETALGAYQKAVIGGESTAIDQQAPSISIQIAKANSNGTYPEDVKVKINFSDDLGILLNDGILGKETKYVINGNEDATVYLNRLLKLRDSSSKNVFTEIALNDLKEGTNTIEITTWDVSGKATTEIFLINVGFEVGISVYPNPFKDNLHIKVINSLQNNDYELIIDINDGIGNLIYSKEISPNSPEIEQLVDFSSSDLEKFQRGIYYYTIKMRFRDSGLEHIEKGKLVKL